MHLRIQWPRNVLMMTPGAQSGVSREDPLWPEGSRAAARTGETNLAATIASVARGDSAALAALYDTTVSMVYSLAERLLRDPFQAEEAVLDVYNYVWERATRFDSERGTVRAWLLTITRGRSLDRLRANRARALRQEPLTEFHTPADVSSEKYQPEPQALANERTEVLERGLAELPEKQRRVVEQAFLFGKTHETIAAESGEPLGTIKSQIRRGLLRLHDLLAGSEVDQ